MISIINNNANLAETNDIDLPITIQFIVNRTFQTLTNISLAKTIS